jgi:hypothetical protein
MKPHLFIATPTHRSFVDSHYALSLAHLAAHLGAAQIGFRIFMQDGADLAQQRNVIAAEFLSLTKATHVLMIDDDTAFPADVVLALLKSEKEFIGCLCPRRDLAGGYVSEDEILGPAGGAATPTRAIGMGLTLIARSVFESMISKNAALSSPRGYRFFDRLDGPDAQHGEDFSFCIRWRQTGGEIFALKLPGVRHVGKMAFTGKRLIEAEG